MKEDLWLEFINNGCCGLCGNTGAVNTLGVARSVAGVWCGVKMPCICPNGRAIKKRIGAIRAAPASEPSGEREKELQALREERDLVAMYYRRRVWMNHGCTPGFVYGDDGEMQCSARGCPVIDFRRLSIQEIERRLYERALSRHVPKPPASEPSGKCGKRRDCGCGEPTHADCDAPVGSCPSCPPASASEPSGEPEPLLAVIHHMTLMLNDFGQHEPECCCAADEARHAADCKDCECGLAEAIAFGVEQSGLSLEPPSDPEEEARLHEMGVRIVNKLLAPPAQPSAESPREPKS